MAMGWLLALGHVPTRRRPFLRRRRPCAGRYEKGTRCRPPDAAGITVFPARRSNTARYVSERADVLRLRPLLPLGRVELDLLVLIERPVAGARDRREVDEHVRRTVVGGNEPKALVRVEPLHCSRCHTVHVLYPPCHDATSPRHP